MDTPALRTPPEAPTRGHRLAAEVGLALLAATLLALRAISAARRDTLLPSVQTLLITAAVLAALLAVGAAWTAGRSQRLTAWLLGGALLLELLLSRAEARVPLVVTLPLLAALVLVLRPMLQRERQGAAEYTVGRRVVAWVSVTLMAPIGYFYLAIGLLVPDYAVPVAWLIYLLLLLGTIRLALRRSWWVAAGPVLASIIWFVGLWATEYFLGWTA